MKFYCIEINQCGFFDQTTDYEEYKDLICPICFSPLLRYQDDEDPYWVEELVDFTIEED